jgi:hypothetical protein
MVRSYSAEYPGVDVEKLTLNNVNDALHSEDWPRVCKVVGGFIELVAVARYGEFQRTKPKNLRVAIDFIMDNDLIARPLGAKMHLVRELRNIEAHRLSYPISKDDAKISEQILMDLISWMHGDKLRESWNKIVKMFESGEALLNSGELRSSEELPDPMAIPSLAVRRLQDALHEAIDLKLYSLGIAWTPQTNLFSKIERLIKVGIDARSEAWRDLVARRSFDAHAKEPSAREATLEHLRFQDKLIELRKVLFTLQPTFGPMTP